MNAEEELRLECLRLAITSREGDPIAEAKRMEDYVKGKSAD